MNKFSSSFLFLTFSATIKWLQNPVKLRKTWRKQFLMFVVTQHAELSSKNISTSLFCNRGERLLLSISCRLLIPSTKYLINIKARWPRGRVEMRKIFSLLLLSFSICEIWYNRRQGYWLSFNFIEHGTKSGRRRVMARALFQRKHEATWSSHEMSRKIKKAEKMKNFQNFPSDNDKSV